MVEKRKAAELSAGLLAVKGTATPTPDTKTRAAPPTSVEEAEPETNQAPLNFRVSSAFRREFKTYAAQHDLKLNELLRRAFDVYKKQKDQ